MLKNGIFCEMVILVIFKVFLVVKNLVVKNLENLIQIVPDSPIYYYYKTFLNLEHLIIKQKNNKKTLHLHLYYTFGYFKLELRSHTLSN